MMVIGAEDRNRTGTVITNRGILSPVRLPVPPPRQQLMERVMGIEPTRPAWKAGALPLSYTRRSSMELARGIEPPTC